MKRSYLMLLLMLLCVSLQGCWNIASTGAQAIYNRRSIEKTVSDQYITMQINHLIKFNTKAFADSNIAISTYNGVVLLTGQVPQAWQKAKASYLVQTVEGVKEVHNLITIQAPSSSLTRVSDAWITSKVKARIIASDEVDPTQVKVITENGTVYLMGILPPDEASAAADLASETGGVKSVVKIFSYLFVSKSPKMVG